MRGCYKKQRKQKQKKTHPVRLEIWFMSGSNLCQSMWTADVHLECVWVTSQAINCLKWQHCPHNTDLTVQILHACVHDPNKQSTHQGSRVISFSEPCDEEYFSLQPIRECSGHVDTGTFHWELNKCKSDANTPVERCDATVHEGALVELL